MISSDYQENDGVEEEEPRHVNSGPKKSNVLPLWGNDRTMNLNPLILTNIQSSHYFKVNLYELKTYHEVIDEIYYKVSHLEPWEKGSRKTAGQTGMCGGVRGVGAGGIVSTAYCLLFKLFTLKLTRKQVNGLITHPDSPYIRALGFMYIRYTQPPADLWDWYEEYLEDDEELDVKAGGGQVMTMGNILKNFLCKLEWFSTLFPRIPVPIQQKIEKCMGTKFANVKVPKPILNSVGRHNPEVETHYMDNDKLKRNCVPLDNRNNKEREVARREMEERRLREREKEREREREIQREREREREKEREREIQREREREKEKERERERRAKEEEKRSRSRGYSREKERERKWKHSREKHHRRSRSRQRHRH